MAKTIGVFLSLQDKCIPVISIIVQKIGMTAKTINKQIGMERKLFQTWNDIVTRNSSGNVESFEMGCKSLASQIDNTFKRAEYSVNYVDKPGIAVDGSARELKIQDGVSEEAVTKLILGNNFTEKTIVSQKLFGKSSVGIKTLLSKNKETINSLNSAHGKTSENVSCSFGSIGINGRNALTPEPGFVKSAGVVFSHLKTAPAAGSLIETVKLTETAIGCRLAGLAAVGISSLPAAAETGCAKVFKPMKESGGMFMDWSALLGYKQKLVKEFNQLTQAAASRVNPGLNVRNFRDSGSCCGDGKMLADMLPRAGRTKTNQTSAMHDKGNNVSVTLNVNGSILGNKEILDELLQYMATELRKVMLV